MFRIFLIESLLRIYIYKDIQGEKCSKPIITKNYIDKSTFYHFT